MRTSPKLLVWLLACTGTLLAVLVTLVFFVAVKLYRDRIEQQVSTAFGREVVLDGPLSLEPSLTPRFATNGLKNTIPDWTSRPFLATVNKFVISVSLLPLLRGDLEIVALDFHGVDLLLEKTATVKIISPSANPAS